MYVNMRVISIRKRFGMSFEPILTYLQHWINLLTHSVKKIDIQKTVYLLIQNLTENSIKMLYPKFQVMVKKKLICASNVGKYISFRSLISHFSLGTHSEECNAFLRIRSVQQREHIFVENDNRKSLSLYHELCNYAIWGGGRLLMAMEMQGFSSFS